MKKQIMKRTLSVFLSMVMVLMILPVGLLSTSAESCTHATKSAWVKYDNAQHLRTCGTCTVVEYAPHNWKESDTLTDGGSGSGDSSNMGDLDFGDVSIPTTGTVTYYCTDCGATTTDTTAEVPHEHTGEWTDVGAKHTRICDVCGEAQTVDHNWDEGVLIKASTHTEAGEKFHTCTECGATKTELIAVLSGHNWVEVEIEDSSLTLLPDSAGDVISWGNLVFNPSNPDISTAKTKWVCSDCGALTYVNPFEHVCVYDECRAVDDEYHTYFCECGAMSPEVEQPHTWDEGVTADGKITYTCTECKHTKVEDAPAILWGDANNDGAVDLKDAVLLAVYMANYDYDTGTSTTEVFEGADANGDGTVDLKDAVLLAVYMANYDYDTNSSTTVLGPQA